MEQYQQRYIESMLLTTPHKSAVSREDLRLYQINALHAMSGRHVQQAASPRVNDNLVSHEHIKTKEIVHSVSSNGECALDLTVSAKKRPSDDMYKENVQVKHARYSYPTAQHAMQKIGLLQHSRVDLASQANNIPNGHLDKKQTIERMICSPRSDLKQDQYRTSLDYKRGELTHAQSSYSHPFNSVVSSGDGHSRTVLEHSKDSHHILFPNQQRTVSGKRVCSQSNEHSGPSGQVDYVSFRDTRPSLIAHNIQPSLHMTTGKPHISQNHDYNKYNVSFTDANVTQLQSQLQHSLSKTPVAQTSSCADLLYRQNVYYKTKVLSSPESTFHHSASMLHTPQQSPSQKSVSQTSQYKDMNHSNLQYFHSNHIEQPEHRSIPSSSTSVYPASHQVSYASLLNNSKSKTASSNQTLIKQQQPTFSKLIQHYRNNIVPNISKLSSSHQSVQQAPTVDTFVSDYSPNKKPQHVVSRPHTNVSSMSSRVSVSEMSRNKTSDSSPRKNSASIRMNSERPVGHFDKIRQDNTVTHDIKTGSSDILHSRTLYQNRTSTMVNGVSSPRSDCFSMLNEEPNVQLFTQKERRQQQTNQIGEFSKGTCSNVSKSRDIQCPDTVLTNVRKGERSEKCVKERAPTQQLSTSLFPDKCDQQRIKVKQEIDVQPTLDKFNSQRIAKSVIFDLLTKSNDKMQSDELNEQRNDIVRKITNENVCSQRESDVSKEAGQENSAAKDTSPKKVCEMITKVNKASEISDFTNKNPQISSIPKPRMFSSTTNVSAGLPFSKKRIILDAVSKDKDLCKFIEDASCARTINSVGFNPDSPEMPTLSPQQKLTNSCTISPNPNEPPVLECLDSDRSGKANSGLKTSMSHSVNPANTNTPAVLPDSKGFFPRDTFPRRPSIMKNIPVANVAPMIKNKNINDDGVPTGPERLINDSSPTEDKCSLVKPEASDDTPQAIPDQFDVDIKTSRVVSKKKKRRAASRTKRAKQRGDDKRHQRCTVKLQKSRSDLQRTIRRLKRSTRNRTCDSKDSGEDISHRITRSNRSIRLRCASGSTRLPRYNRNAAYENELKNEQRRNAQRKLKPRRRIRIVYTEREDECVRENDVSLDSEICENEVEKTIPVLDSQSELRPKTLKSRSPRTWAQRRGAKRRIRRHFTPRGCARIVQKSVYDTREELPHTPSARRSLFSDFDATEFDNVYEDKDYQDFIRLQNDIRSLVVNKSLGETLLHKAVRVGNKEIVEYCLEKDSHNVNAKDNAGYTPLHEACVTGNELIALMLLKNGSDINACSQDGIRPIHDAVENHHVSIVRLLLKYGADPTLTNYAGKSPLKLAKTHQMYTFLSGCLDDLNGTDDTVDVWQFMGSSVLDTERESEIFAEMPSDPEDDSDDMFQYDDAPQFSTIHLNSENEQGLEEYTFIEDVLQYYQIDYETFQKVTNDCQALEVISLSREEVLEKQYHNSVHISKLDRDQPPIKLVLKSQWMPNSSFIHSKLAEHRKLGSLNFTEFSDVQNNNTIMFDKEVPSKVAFTKQQSVAVVPTVRPSVIKLMNKNCGDGISVNSTDDTSDLIKVPPENKLNSNSMWITPDCYEMDHFRFKVGTVPNDCFDLNSNQNCLKKYTALVRPCKDNTLMPDVGSLLDVTY